MLFRSRGRGGAAEQMAAVGDGDGDRSVADREETGVAEEEAEREVEGLPASAGFGSRGLKRSLSSEITWPPTVPTG